jgi:hypothetical protein
MTTLLTGTFERTVGWFHAGAQRSAHAENPSVSMHAPAQRAVPLELRVSQWFCRTLRGHEFIRGIDGRRMYLICQHCFHETPGWEIAARPPRSRD